MSEVRRRARRARASAVLLLVSAFLSVAAYSWVVTFDPRPWAALVIAAGPLLCPGLPAALFLLAIIRRGDPYDVTRRTRSVRPPE